MPLCDGCGAQVDEAHIRRRIERLELATRFRPIHIQVLLLDAAPPALAGDYFYRAAIGSEGSSAASERFFVEMAKCIGYKGDALASEESFLTEFQRRGLFLAHAVECPVESPELLAAAVQRLASTVVLRVSFSYKPKFVAPISQALQPVISLLEGNGWSDRLIVRDGQAVDESLLGEPQRQAEFSQALGDRLSHALAPQT